MGKPWIIDTHSHPGSEIEGIDTRPWMKVHARAFHASGPAVFPRIVQNVRNYFVEKGRWPKSALDENSLMPLTIEDLIFSMDDAEIEKTVIVGRNFKFPPLILPGKRVRLKHVYVPVEYTAKMIDKYPDRLVGVAPITPWDDPEENKKYIKYVIEDLHFKGIGELWPPQGIYLADKERCYPIYEKCVEYDVPVDVHIGSEPQEGVRLYHNEIDCTKAIYLDQVAKDFPELRIICHAQYDSPWVATQQYNQNIWLNMSIGWHPVYLTQPWLSDYLFGGPKMFEFMMTYLPDRCCFGCEYPWAVPQTTQIEWCKNQPCMTDELKKKFFRTNAMEIYKL